MSDFSAQESLEGVGLHLVDRLHCAAGASSLSQLVAPL